MGIAIGIRLLVLVICLNVKCAESMASGSNNNNINNKNENIKKWTMHYKDSAYARNQKLKEEYAKSEEPQATVYEHFSLLAPVNAPQSEERRIITAPIEKRTSYEYGDKNKNINNNNSNKHKWATNYKDSDYSRNKNLNEYAKSEEAQSTLNDHSSVLAPGNVPQNEPRRLVTALTEKGTTSYESDNGNNNINNNKNTKKWTINYKDSAYARNQKLKETYAKSEEPQATVFEHFSLLALDDVHQNEPRRFGTARTGKGITTYEYGGTPRPPKGKWV